ncbi:hypothetical protein PHLGIDRAFT_123200 [Phlebiopsis gigantea 11061_1 CR5-6]|uniref:Uncharacterized protein n=1 Tax=Phlebiopsis gigantea (strain 11061_1 CR5-6) TaxID=745531 RepID=A0A0C3PA21_PHLG1|nr:hypothetical protein PHLGIDRAFT_123200 [Phlebiopsis gigantea 11061_1 CR5-6]
MPATYMCHCGIKCPIPTLVSERTYRSHAKAVKDLGRVPTAAFQPTTSSLQDHYARAAASNASAQAAPPAVNPQLSSETGVEGLLSREDNPKRRRIVEPSSQCPQDRQGRNGSEHHDDDASLRRTYSAEDDCPPSAAGDVPMEDLDAQGDTLVANQDGTPLPSASPRRHTVTIEEVPDEDLPLPSDRHVLPSEDD